MRAEFIPAHQAGDVTGMLKRGGDAKRVFRRAAAAMWLALSCWAATTGVANAQLPSIGGDLTPYLVGEFDFIKPLADNAVSAMENRYTIHNPTNFRLRFLASPFDFSGAPANIAGVTCWSGDLPPNGGSFLAIAAVDGFPTVPFGTFKIVSLSREGRPAAGIVGFHERFFYKGDGPLGGKTVVAGSRSNLASVPIRALRNGELEKIKGACETGGAAGAQSTGAPLDSDDGRVRIRTYGAVVIRRAR